MKLKKITGIFLLTFTSLVSQAQEKQLEVESKIHHVNLFLQGAQIKRECQVEVEKGITRLQIGGVTSQLDPATLQVSAGNQLIILSVSSYSRVQTNPKKLPIIRMLEDSISLLGYQLEEEKNSRFVLEQQESLLLTNKELKGDKGVVLIDLEDALTIYQKQLTTIKKGQLDSRVREKRLQDRLLLLQKQLDEFRQSNQQPSYEVSILVSAAARTKGRLELSYFVQNASWQPIYDIRVGKLNEPVKLQYKASIRNNSGENWDNVVLNLSSGNPNLSGVAPVLNPVNLYYTDPVMQGGEGYFQNGFTYNWRTKDGKKREDVVMDNVTATEQKNTSFEFQLGAAVMVVANNQPQILDLITHDLSGTFTHFTVPKLEKEAFLLTRVTGWEDLNLLAGSANLYFEGTFLGITEIDPYITGDTLSLSLGRDKGIVVKREKLKEFCSTNFSGSRKKEVLVYEISIKNTKKESVSLIIEDQIPLSSNKEISVEVNEISGASYDQTSGKLIWNKSLAPGETLTLRIGFEVKYPKDKLLMGL